MINFAIVMTVLMYLLALDGLVFFIAVMCLFIKNAKEEKEFRERENK